MDPLAVNPLLGMLATERSRAPPRRHPHPQSDARHARQAVRRRRNLVRQSRERLLDDAIGRTKRGMRAFATDQNDEVAVWHWDDAAKKLSVARFPIEEAQIIWAARLALWNTPGCGPTERLAQCQALVLGLEADAITSGRPSPEVLKLLDAADGDYAQHGARRRDEARPAPRRRRRREDARPPRRRRRALSPSRRTPAPLAAALKYPDRRVRFTALSAIMALDPPAPFPGASRVPETLGYFATGAAERRAVVAMPVLDHATTLAGRLAGIDIEAEPAARGGAAVALAQQSSDLEMVLVDMDIDGPGIRDVLYSLRAEPATGQIPIGLLATGDRLDAAHRLAGQHQRVVAFPRPQSDEALADLVARLGEVGGRNTISPQDRAAMAGQALEWLGELLARDHTFYDLHRQAPVVTAALYMPAMTDRAVAALALLGTPDSQRSLVDFASHLSVPVAAREQAARAFADERPATRHPAHRRRNPPPVRPLQRQRVARRRHATSLRQPARCDRVAPRPSRRRPSPTPAYREPEAMSQSIRNTLERQTAGRAVAGHHRLRRGDAGGLPRHAAGRPQPARRCCSWAKRARARS